MAEDRLYQSTAWNLFLISLGAALFGFGVQAILIHQNFIIGGLFGTMLLVYYKTSILTPGLLFLLINIPIMAIGFFLISKRFFLYSVYGVLAMSLASELISFDLHIGNQFYAAVAGGVICGFGSGLILRSLGSGGGLDIIAIALNQKFNFGIGKFFFIYNIVLFISLTSLYSIDLVIASLILTFISSVTLEYVLALFNQRKIVYILSDIGPEIAKVITNQLRQGATVIDAKGAYSGKDKQMLMTITNNLQLKRLEEKVFTVDPDALFIVENSFNVIGSSYGRRKIY